MSVIVQRSTRVEREFRERISAAIPTFGSAATLDVGTGAGEVAAGDHTHGGGGGTGGIVMVATPWDAFPSASRAAGSTFTFDVTTDVGGQSVPSGSSAVIVRAHVTFATQAGGNYVTFQANGGAEVARINPTTNSRAFYGQFIVPLAANVFSISVVGAQAANPSQVQIVGYVT